MKDFIVVVLINVFTGFALFGQQTIVNDVSFAIKINELLQETVDFISVEELSNLESNQVLILDAREEEEYNVSHISGAQYIGYKNPNYSIIKEMSKDIPIIIYCSIGYRSEKIGEKLKAMGFQSVRNLYGSIFEWVNQGHEIVDLEGNPTLDIHCYNRKWSKWMTNPEYQKVW